jgi:signal transduction histidine kinase
VNRVQGEGPVQCEFVAESLPPLAAEVEHELFRIAQEAVHNAIKHAAARKVTLSLETCREVLIMKIQDDGQGFDQTKLQTSAGGFGFLVMRERSALIGARLTIDSAPGRGATLTVRVLLSTSPDRKMAP